MIIWTRKRQLNDLAALLVFRLLQVMERRGTSPEARIEAFEAMARVAQLTADRSRRELATAPDPRSTPG